MEWILIADSAQARLLRRESDAEPLVPMATFEHEEGRMRTSAIGDDRPGHGASDRHVGGVRFEPRTDPHRKGVARFAHDLGRRLEEAAEHDEYARLSVYAAPEVLGVLRNELGPAARRRLRVAAPLDLVSFGLDELERRIATAVAEHAPHHVPSD